MENKNVSLIKAVSLALLVDGILLLISAVMEQDSSISDISRFFTSSTTDMSIWMLVGGVVVTIMGLMGLLRGSKTVGE
jgi:hypothetical protein